MRAAVIDVGTNSVLLLVAERRPDGSFVAVDERMEITRLGKGVDRTGELAPDAVEATVEALASFARAARQAGAEALSVTATSAARDARNGRLFFDRAREAAGVEVEVLSGDLEAELSYEAARADFGPGPLAILDIGGGSTEVVVGEGERLAFRRSFDVGAVRLTERHLASDPPSGAELAALRADLARAVADVPRAPAGARVVGIAGTVTTLCAISLGLDGYDGRLVHGKELPAPEVRALADRLAPLPLEARRHVPGLPPKRADTIVAGAEILLAVLERLGGRALTVSDKGIRWGLLARRYA